MKTFATLEDKQKIENYLRRRPHLNFYHLGDLDDFFWPHTRWHVSQDDGEIDALVLLYTAPDPIVLLAILNDNQHQMSDLLVHLQPQLPERIYAHLSPGLEDIFQAKYTLRHHGEHYKMTLTNPAALDQFSLEGLITLDKSHLPQIHRLYQQSYPGNWFDPRMLQTGQYLGLDDERGELICIAGIHVVSTQYRIAALGNITTHPTQRERGLATRVTAVLCKHLLETVDVIGLNVRTDNTPAICAYSKIGFEVAGIYNEWMMAL
jgi:GNAT superfamily N-acetyltransferase